MAAYTPIGGGNEPSNDSIIAKVIGAILAAAVLLALIDML